MAATPKPIGLIIAVLTIMGVMIAASRVAVLAAAALIWTSGCRSGVQSTTPAGFAATVPDAGPAPSPARDGMVWIPGGEFSMGSEAADDSLCDVAGITRDAQ